MHLSTRAGCPPVWIFPIQMLFQKALGFMRFLKQQDTL